MDAAAWQAVSVGVCHVHIGAHSEARHAIVEPSGNMYWEYYLTYEGCSVWRDHRALSGDVMHLLCVVFIRRLLNVWKITRPHSPAHWYCWLYWQEITYHGHWISKMTRNISKEQSVLPYEPNEPHKMVSTRTSKGGFQHLVAIFSGCKKPIRPSVSSPENRPNPRPEWR